jgi:adenylate cyclase class 2
MTVSRKTIKVSKTRVKSSVKLRGSSKNIRKSKKVEKKPMEVEYEARFLEINRDDLLAKIKNVGGTVKKPNTIYKRSMFGLCDISRGYVRVRDEGDKVTMTAKLYKDKKFPQEYELNIKDNFENGQEFLRALNLTEKSYHETMREKWTIPKRNGVELCEIAIDCVPGLPMYAEVECKSKEDLSRAIKLLKLNRKNMRFGGYGKVYAEYYGLAETEINNKIASITFKNIKEELKPYLHKNTDLLDTIADQHLELYNKLSCKN